MAAHRTAPKSTPRRKPPARKDAITVLTADHERMRQLLHQLENADAAFADKREELLGLIEVELKVHTQIEEQLFYPAFRQAAHGGEDRKLYYEALEEHHVVDLVLPEIREADPRSNEFAAKAKVLKDLVEHHAEEEESEMFRRARKLISRKDLARLGEELERTREAVQPGTLDRLVGLVRP